MRYVKFGLFVSVSFLTIEFETIFWKRDIPGKMNFECYFQCAAPEQAKKRLLSSGNQYIFSTCNIVHFYFKKSSVQQCFACIPALSAISEWVFLHFVSWEHSLLARPEQEPPMDCTKRNSRSTVFRIVPKFKKEKVQKQKTSPQPGRWSALEGKV